MDLRRGLFDSTRSSALVRECAMTQTYPKNPLPARCNLGNKRDRMRVHDQLTLAVTGDVGLLSEENAQRLLSIFAERAMSCLESFRQIAQSRSRDAAQAEKNCARGLASVGQWSVDVLNEEVMGMEAMYPETSSLHRYVYVAVVSELASAHPIGGLVIPPLMECYHAFLKRLVASSDVARLTHFLESPMAHRRVVFLDAFRNAYHDLARRSLDMSGKTLRTDLSKKLPVLPAMREDGLSEEKDSQRAGSACKHRRETTSSPPSRPPGILRQKLEALRAEARKPGVELASHDGSAEDAIEGDVGGGESGGGRDVVLLSSTPAFFEEPSAWQERGLESAAPREE